MLCENERYVQWDIGVFDISILAISIIDILTRFENIDIDKVTLENMDIDIDIDKVILENIDINIDIDKDILGKKSIFFSRNLSFFMLF